VVTNSLCGGHRTASASRLSGLALAALIAGLAGLAPRAAAAEDERWLCRLTQGPRAGQSLPAEHAGPCGDGVGSTGQAVRVVRHTAKSAAPSRPVIVQESRAYSSAPSPRPPETAAMVGGGSPAGGSALGGLAGAVGAVAGRPRPAGVAEFASTAPLGTRLFTPPIYEIPKGYGAVAVLAFPHPPADDDERARYRAVCAAYVTVLQDSAVASAEAPDRPQMVTLWPRDDLQTAMSVRAPRSATDLSRICDAAVEHYAYLAADGWLSQLPRTVAFERASRGPFLVAWAPPTARGRPNVPILRYDLSDFAAQSEFVDSFSLWKNEIEDDPSLWASGWDLTRWKLKTRALSDHYADRIFAGLKLVPWIGGH
jgi:hypothetical protein